jgi:dTDP-4-dehydrorhamnose reductase
LSTKKNILVTGANGQLGMEFRQLEKKYDYYTFLFVTKEELSITDTSAVEHFFKENHIDICLNCAAYTAVDKAEADPEMAAKINCDAVRNLSEAASKLNAVLIHTSTDYVFDGTSCVPYTEEAPVNPQSAYGITKSEGEKAALRYNKAIVIRTAWLYSTFGNNFVKTMLRLGNERRELGIVFDQTGTPTYANDLASAILKVIDFTEKQGIKPGIYHYSNEGTCSWYDFAWEIMNYTETSCKIKPIETKDYPLPAKRPAYSVLNKSKIKKTFGIEIAYWKTSLYKCLKELNIK